MLRGLLLSDSRHGPAKMLLYSFGELFVQHLELLALAHLLHFWFPFSHTQYFPQMIREYVEGSDIQRLLVGSRNDDIPDATLPMRRRNARLRIHIKPACMWIQVACDLEELEIGPSDDQRIFKFLCDRCRNVEKDEIVRLDEDSLVGALLFEAVLYSTELHGCGDRHSQLYVCRTEELLPLTTSSGHS